MIIEALRKALDRSFVMGQNYWADADSESYSANRRSDVTRQKFNTVRDEICESTNAVLAEKDALLRQALEVCSAFRGAFDTPISRRRTSDEFADDARQRMRELDEAIRNHLGVKND